MEYQLCYLEFGVANLDEIRLLVTKWKAVLLKVFDTSLFDVEYHTHLVSDWEQVRVVIEDRVPGQEVLLNFIAPGDRGQKRGQTRANGQNKRRNPLELRLKY